jgi:MFS family permease
MSSDTAQGQNTVLRDTEFLKLWVGETISEFGSQITVLALPLAAIIVLDAGPAELGILNALKFLPFVLVALPAGVLLDRTRRRPVLAVANLGSAIVIGSVPIAAALGVHAIEHLYAVAFFAGLFAVLLHVGNSSYVPTLVRRSNLIDANSKLTASASAASVGGPGIGGLLIQFASAPGALLLDALSFVFAAIGVLSIRRPEPSPTALQRASVVSEVRDGLRYVLANRYLRALCAEAATYNAFSTATMTVFLLYATDSLGIAPGILGLMFSTGGAGAVIGALVAARLDRRYGFGRTIVTTMFLGTWPFLLLPFASSPGIESVLLLAAVFAATSCAIAISNVLITSLRQTVTPDALLGRMTASYRFISWGAIPLGGLLGGSLGGTLGIREALLIGVVGIAVAPLWIVASPILKLRTQSDILAEVSGSTSTTPAPAAAEPTVQPPTADPEDRHG